MTSNVTGNVDSDVSMTGSSELDSSASSSSSRMEDSESDDDVGDKSYRELTTVPIGQGGSLPPHLVLARCRAIVRVTPATK